MAVLARQVLKRDLSLRTPFVFHHKRGNLVKLLWHQSQRLCLLGKRLERGRFTSLARFSKGIDWRAPLRTARPELAGLIAAEYALTLVIPRY